MSGRGGRDLVRRDYPSRYEEDKGSGDRGLSGSNNPPSRHLWVGNISHNIVEDELAHHFSQFGPLESIAFQPGRSYAFVNFENNEDAMCAIEELQGFPLAGNPLRIEFAKADKPLTISRDEHYSRDERISSFRVSPFSQREPRGRHGSPLEPLNSDKSKLLDKNPEPSEILWIGFPALLKVDESILRKEFSPFGEIVKITTFPGRSYAFVRFRNLKSACRAKDTLKGKLFGNPRVHICFAKGEAGSSSSGRSSFNAPHSPIYRTGGREGSYENLRQDRSFSGDHNISSSNFFPKWDRGDSDDYDLNRRGSSWAGGTNTYEQRKIAKGTPLRHGLSEEICEYTSFPSRERHVPLVDLPHRFPHEGAFCNDLPALPEDVRYLRDAKKLKTGSPPPERELPEYPFSELERQKRAFPQLIPDFPQRESFNNDSGNVAYRHTLDCRPNSPMACLDRCEDWKSYDSFQMGPGALHSNFVERKRFIPEPDNSSVTEWKWEGTIAKGGTPVCRARCFPVGKVLDIMLPEFLDCTARTGLDMLSKHYYQAVGVWVVFFVPGSDADIEFYNEFMHYLEEKQRAAVAKLDDKTTLFLVPPSDFSEKVLKVPGKLSISGVILRLENPGLNHAPVHHIQRETKYDKLFPYDENIMYSNPSFPLAARMPSPQSNSGISSTPFLGNKFTAAPCDYPPVQSQNPTSGPNWSAHNLQNLISTSTLLSDAVEPMNHLSVPMGVLQPEQLGQLAASLHEQQRQTGSSLSVPALNDQRQNNGSESSSHKYAVENHVSSKHSASQFGQVLQLQQQQQTPNVPQTSQSEPQRGANGNQQQQLTYNNLQEDAEADPQKRLQATLQLAAVLLQQIQQGKKS